MRFNKQPVMQGTELSSEFKLYLLAVSPATHTDNLTGVEARVKDLVGKVAPEFTAKLASYTRRKLNNRTAALLLTAELCRQHGGAWSRAAVFNVVQRVDEFADLTAAVAQRSQLKSVPGGVHKKAKLSNIPNSLKRGLAAVFESGRFDEFQYSKWDKQNCAIKLRDVLFMVRPKPQNEGQVELFKKIADRKLTPAVTHEKVMGKIRAEGGTKEEIAEATCEAWAELLVAKKLSHLALIRECKHILSADERLASLYVEEFLRTAEKANTFPHSYKSMLEMVTQCPGISMTVLKKLVDAVQQVMLLRANRVGSLFGKRIVVVIDVSASMGIPVNYKHGSVKRYDVALSLGCALLASGDHRGIVFSDRAAYVPPISTDLFTAMMAVQNIIPNGCTDFSAAQKLIQKLDAASFDAVLVLTDMGFNTGLDATASGMVSCSRGKPVYFVDIDGSNLEHPVNFSKNCYFLAGLSEASIELMQKVRQGNSVIDEIMAYALISP